MPRPTRKRIPANIKKAIIENQLRPPDERLPAALAAKELDIPFSTYRGITKRLRDSGELPPLSPDEPLISKLEPVTTSTRTNPLPGTEMAALAAEKLEDTILKLVSAGATNVTPQQEDQILVNIMLNGTESGQMRAIEIRRERRLASGATLGPPPPSTRGEQISRVALILSSLDPDDVQPAVEEALQLRTRRSQMPAEPLKDVAALIDTPEDITRTREREVPQGLTGENNAPDPE